MNLDNRGFYFSLIIALCLAVCFLAVVVRFQTIELKQTIAERRSLELDIDANAAEIAVLGERIENIKAAMTLTGKASWYGTRGEQGKRTANGEMFDREKYSVALPWPLLMDRWYWVRRTDTGAAVRVWANDRIPLKWKRIADLSEAAAGEIGMTQTGIVEVKIEPCL